MQTVVRVMGGGRSRAQMMEDYVAEFCAKEENGTRAVEFPAPGTEGVEFAWDDVEDGERLPLGSFGRDVTEDPEKTVYIFVSPLILSTGHTESNVRFWVASPSPG